ncbi:MAG: hypothetical protein KDB94_10315 [Acidobacteria bacterium]|nr:hypothetical protein [Acidobacteriota bacterium]MCB9377595.1 hypothetical protein [Holophagales bacterium]
MRIALLTIAALALLATAAAAADDDLRNRTPEERMRGIESEHPAACYLLARELFASGEKDEAVFWFYVGQLRYRFHLAANPGLDPSGDPALFASLNEEIGRTINEYAFGGQKAFLATIDRVLAWDEATPNGYTSKTDHAEAWREIRGGLGEMRRYVVENGDKIRAQRAANGLENRD